jgi:uncharacterized LabA/DUF88 family protein
LSRVIGYVDGFNLYYGLKERKWRQFYWIDPYKLISALVVPDEELAGVKYFTARVVGPDEKRNRQSAYLDALRAVSQAECIFGKYYRKKRECFNCRNTWPTYEEKMTDSAIAANLVADAFRDQFDTAYLVGGDTDIVPAIKMVRRWFPKKRLIVWFPPARRNSEVSDHCHDEGAINGEHLKSALMPDQVSVGDGVVVERPTRWAVASPDAPKG